MKTKGITARILIPIIVFMLVVSILAVLMTLLKKETAYILSVFSMAVVLMMLFVMMIIRKNLVVPLRGIMSKINSGECAIPTYINELDELVDVVNNALADAELKNLETSILHKIAISLNKDMTLEETMDTIVDQANKLIVADLSAIALYDDLGKFSKIHVRGVSIGTKDYLPEGRGVLELMRLSLSSVRIDNIAAHPAFSGSFPEGHPVVKNFLGHPIFSDEGKPIGALYFGNKAGGFTDEDESILKAISADAAIALNKADRLKELSKFKQMIESAFDVIVITDANGYITYANPAFVHLTGFTVSEALGKKTNILKSGHHDNNFYKALWDKIKGGDIWRGDFINKKKSGEIYYASSVIFPIYTEGQVNFASIQRDVTQEKRLYEQLLRAQKMDAIGTLAGGIAHDFNNLLTAILGYSEIMLSLTKEGDQFYKPVTIIQNAAEKGAELAKKILTITRKEKMETRPVDINEVVKNSMELLQRSIPMSIEIVTNLREDLPKIKADPSQMQQVIMNLCVNARDAMPEGGKLIIETSSVGTEHGAASGIASDNGELVKLSISDTGTGMDNDTQRKIFDPFFTTKESGKGTGLGLYIVHSIINNHGGYINLYSEPFKGTQFKIYLPTTTDKGIGESRNYVDIKGSGMVLVIDDEPDIRELCRDIMEPLGYKVLLAGSGIDGINLFRRMKDDIELVVLDMIMPKMGGQEVFQALRNIEPEVKILICSGYSQAGFAGIETLLKLGGTLFIQKPFTRQSIGQAIKKILNE